MVARERYKSQKRSRENSPSSQELLELLGEAGGMTIIGCYPIFCLPYRIGMLSRSRKRDLKALKIEIVQRKQLAYELCRAR